MTIHHGISAKTILWLTYLAGSVTMAGLYWAIGIWIDQLPCREMLCNLEYVFFIFGPVAIISIAWPLINGGILWLQRESTNVAAPRFRLFLSSIGTGASLAFGAFLFETWGAGDFESLFLLHFAYATATSLNLYTVAKIIQKRFSHHRPPEVIEGVF